MSNFDLLQAWRSALPSVMMAHIDGRRPQDVFIYATVPLLRLTQIYESVLLFSEKRIPGFSRTSCRPHGGCLFIGAPDVTPLKTCPTCSGKQEMVRISTPNEFLQRGGDLNDPRLHLGWLLDHFRRNAQKDNRSYSNLVATAEELQLALGEIFHFCPIKNLEIFVKECMGCQHSSWKPSSSKSVPKTTTITSSSESLSEEDSIRLYGKKQQVWFQQLVEKMMLLAHGLEKLLQQRKYEFTKAEKDEWNDQIFILEELLECFLDESSTASASLLPDWAEESFRGARIMHSSLEAWSFVNLHTLLTALSSVDPGQWNCMFNSLEDVTRRQNTPPPQSSSDTSSVTSSSSTSSDDWACGLKVHSFRVKAGSHVDVKASFLRFTTPQQAMDILKQVGDSAMVQSRQPGALVGFTAYALEYAMSFVAKFASRIEFSVQDDSGANVKWDCLGHLRADEIPEKLALKVEAEIAKRVERMLKNIHSGTRFPKGEWKPVRDLKNQFFSGIRR